MPRRATRPGPPTLLLGVWGAGEATPENITAQLDDFIDGAGNVTPKFLVPLDKELTSDAVLATAQYAIEKGYALEVIYQSKPTTKVLKEILAEASKEHQFDQQVTDDDRFTSTEDAIADNFAVLLGEKGDDARLLFLWAEDDKGEPDEYDQRVLAAVADCGVVALDLSAGLEVLDVSPPEDEPEPEPEPEKPAKKTAAKKTTTAAEPEPEGDDEPDFDTVKEWPIRRMKTHAKKIAAADREDNVEDVPTDDEIDDMRKEDVLDYLFPPGDGDEPEPEPEPTPAKKTAAKRTTKRTEEDPPAEDAPVSGRRARQIREDIEEDGGEPNSGAKRRGRAAAAEKPQDEPEPAAEGGDSEDPRAAFLAAMDDSVNPDLSETEQNEALYDAIDALADVIIDRIAARVEKEPEGSAIRKEVAPPRPPGKPRKDGETPTRRRTARGR